MKLKRMKILRLVLSDDVVRPWLFQIFSYRSTHVNLPSISKTEKKAKTLKDGERCDYTIWSICCREDGISVSPSEHPRIEVLGLSLAILDESLVVVFFQCVHADAEVSGRKCFPSAFFYVLLFALCSISPTLTSATSLLRFRGHTLYSPNSVGLLWTRDRPVAETRN
jgi:hypothetical protein